MKPEIKLWQILVPTVRNDGRPFRTRYHRVWDKRVRDITNGLTICPPTKGQWVDNEDETVYIERMIPVQIACTEAQIETIALMTKEYYDQKAVFCYLLSERVLIL